MNTENSSCSGPPVLRRSQKSPACGTWHFAGWMGDVSKPAFAGSFGVALCNKFQTGWQSGGVKMRNDRKKDQKFNPGGTGGGEVFGNLARAGAFRVEAGRWKRFGAMGDLTCCGQDARGPLGRRGLCGGRRVGGFCGLWGFGERALKTAGGIRLLATWTLGGCEVARKGRLGGEKGSFEAPDQPLAAVPRAGPVAAGCRRLFFNVFFCAFARPSWGRAGKEPNGRPGFENNSEPLGTTRNNTGVFYFFVFAHRVLADCHYEEGKAGQHGRQGRKGLSTVLRSSSTPGGLRRTSRFRKAMADRLLAARCYGVALGKGVQGRVCKAGVGQCPGRSGTNPAQFRKIQQKTGFAIFYFFCRKRSGVPPCMRARNRLDFLSPAFARSCGGALCRNGHRFQQSGGYWTDRKDHFLPCCAVGVARGWFWGRGGDGMGLEDRLFQSCGVGVGRALSPAPVISGGCDEHI
ncbi:MAG: hypothetical protein JWR26_3315 [Pedosphaera sp.]|nr:hypothetical protein [Pedosphaera sp.]